MGQMKSIWQNSLTISGAILSTVCILFFISFQLIELFNPISNPYTGLWTFLIIPAVMVIGLVLIPIGYFKERSRRRRLFPEVKEWPRLPSFDPNNPAHRRGATIVGIGALVVIPLIAISSYEGYHYTDSTRFCGQVCHSVMSPEFTSYMNSPHARVTCAACHIGPGASWYVKSKISGVRQVIAVTFNTFSRPIPTPVENLRPARETCEQCHWPEKFFGAQLRTRPHYLPDEKNTRSEIRVLVKTGGADSYMGVAGGIHWHMALSNKIEYIATDTRRQVIPWVRAVDASGKETVFRSDGKSAQDPSPQGERRRVDCVDCHNRPTHILQPPDRAVNISIETGRISRSLPYAKKITIGALTEPYNSVEEAEVKIAQYMRDAYGKLDPKYLDTRQASINKAIQEAQALYRRNFFPLMKVDWRTHPDNIGHMIFSGCFRCHDNRHISDDKQSIRKDCTACHEFLPQPLQESAARDVSQQVTIEHPYKLLGPHADLNCSACHTGGRAPVASCAGCHTVQNLFRQGKAPMLPRLAEIRPTVMADLDCESCHDLGRPQTPAELAAHCGSCHDKAYGDMVQMWKDDAASGRKKAAAAIEQLDAFLREGRPPDHERAALSQLLNQLQQAINQTDRAGVHHNTDFADAIYQRIIALASEAAKAKQ
jgi:nitrate/TMAO reductase-like tetraheme cytochrome c subunit